MGALTTLTEIAENERGAVEVQPCWRAPPRRVASPQIRNAATLGGNLCQDARCWYYRAGVDCYRAGGNTCYADTPQGQNREHCLFGAEPLYRGVAFGRGAGGGGARGRHRHRRRRRERVVPAEEFFIGPAVDITPHDHPQARRSRDRGALPEEMGRREVLFREGHGSRHLGFRAGERGDQP